MEGDIPFEYNVNVKDRIKNLEAKSGKKPSSNATSTGSLGKKESVQSAVTPMSPDSDEEIEETPAIMDVEMTQLDSPNFHLIDKESNHLTVNGQRNRQDSNSSNDEETPVNIKSLLRRFSSGMTLPFRKKSLIPSNTDQDQSDISAGHDNSTAKPNNFSNPEKHQSVTTNIITKSASIFKTKPKTGINDTVTTATDLEQEPSQGEASSRSKLKPTSGKSSVHIAPNSLDLIAKHFDISKPKGATSKNSSEQTTSTAKQKIVSLTAPTSKSDTSSSAKLVEAKTAILESENPETIVQHSTPTPAPTETPPSPKKKLFPEASLKVLDVKSNLIPSDKKKTLKDTTKVRADTEESPELSNSKSESELQQGSKKKAINFSNYSIHSTNENKRASQTSEESGYGGYESPKPKPRTRISTETNKSTQPTLSNGLGLQVSKITNQFSKHTDAIWIMGMGQVGKSSIVNYLLRQDLSTVYKSRPSLREIVECTATIVDCDDDNLDSTSIVVVDTPGFTNDKEDASLFSSLTQYLNTFPSTNSNIILAVLKYEEDLESLNNFLKAVAYFRQMLDKDSNSSIKVQFVLTHSSSNTLGMQSIQFQTAFERFSEVLRQQTSFTDPTICFHNIKQSLQLPLNSIPHSVNYYPDLLSSIRSISHNPQESYTIHLAFGPTYPKSLYKSCVSNRIPLKPLDHPDTLKMHKTLQNIYQNVSIEPTEIATLLEIGWENVAPHFRKKYQSSLLSLQQVFQRCDLKTFAELPEEPTKVLELLKHVPQHNPATTDLLTETLKLKVPCCYAATYIGQGYNVSKDEVTNVSPFKFTGTLKTSSVGLLPEEISCKVIEDREIVFKFFTSIEDYTMDRFKDLSIRHVTFPKNYAQISTTFTANQKIGYNVIKPNQEPTKYTTATASVEYRAFQLSLNSAEDLKFKPQFWESVSTLPELDIKNSETIAVWGEFFNYWGTHVVKSAYGGGSIQVNFRGKMLTKIYKALKQESQLPSDEFETSKVFQWITGDGLDFARIRMKEKEKDEFLQGCDTDVDARFVGGDVKYQQIDATKLPHDNMAEVRNEWIQSLVVNPIILDSNLVLVPISYFVREKSEGIATKMDVAFEHFYSNFMSLQGKQASCSIL